MAKTAGGVVGVGGVGSRLSVGTCMIAAMPFMRVSHIRCFNSGVESAVQPFVFLRLRDAGRCLVEAEERGKPVVGD